MCINYNIYPPKLQELLQSKKEIYIPRKMTSGENLKLYHRYWSSFDNTYMKVDRIYLINNIEYYSVKYPDKLYGEISYPLNTEYMFELSSDKTNIYFLDDIINTPISLLGSEIRFWFYINKIDFNNTKYNGFWAFLDYNSKSSICDDKYYYVKAIESSNNNFDCRISIDKSKEKREKRWQN